MEIRPCTVSDIYESGIASDYFEYAIDGMATPEVQWSRYEALAAGSMLYPIGAFMDGKLIGFVFVLLTTSLHYGVPIASTESFFVLREYRNTGAGLQLLGAAENLAREHGASGVMVMAPEGKELVQILPQFGYKDTHRLFLKLLK